MPDAADSISCTTISVIVDISAQQTESLASCSLTLHTALPVNVQQSSSLTSFKRRIKLIDFTKYLKGSATDVN